MEVVLKWPYEILKPKNFETLSVDQQKKAIVNTRNALTGILSSLITIVFFSILNVSEVLFPLFISICIKAFALYMLNKKGASDVNLIIALLATNFTIFYCALLIPNSYLIFLITPIAITAILEAQHRWVGLGIATIVLLSILYFFYFSKADNVVPIVNDQQLLYINVYSIISFLIVVSGILNNWVTGHKYHFELLNSSHQESHAIIENQVKDLEDLSLFLGVLSKQSEQFVNQVKGVEKKDERNIELTRILKEYKSQKGFQEKLMVIQQNIGRINHQFYHKLEGIFGKLSKAEKEICSLTKLNYSTKEIARIRGTSEGTIYVTKNRLKNKIKQPSTEEFDLDTLIRSL